jgi:hypothetical protein
MAGIDLADFGINIDVGTVVNQILTIAMIIFLVIIVAGVVFFLMKTKKKKKTPQIKIGWWEDVHGELIPTTMDNAKEVIIPGTRLRVFYIKAKDMWLPRFIRGVKENLFYVAITPRRELVNFTLTSIGADMEKAGLKYDHTDMIWASENLREFVKRNYRDKATPWWKAYQGVITTAIYIIILTFSFVIILYFMRQIVGDIRSLLGASEEIIREIKSCDPQGSGIAPAGQLIPLLFAKFKRRRK